MIKNKIRYTLILLLGLVISEIINGIIFVNSLFKKGGVNDLEEGLMISVSLILYFIMGNIIKRKFNDKRSKDKALLITGKIIMFSYIFSIGLSLSTGQYYIIHMMICSPIAGLITEPVDDIPYLYEMLLTFFSPISVVLIWLFSKIGDRKKKQSDSDI